MSFASVQPQSLLVKAAGRDMCMLYTRIHVCTLCLQHGRSRVCVCCLLLPAQHRHSQVAVLCTADCDTRRQHR